ncbi:major facilitator transporter [Streptomyces davaonensis JCM 4913]|uniref:Major facilitator transporter n=1 Tax=Streptomyces davaonensis (strain DSM 101723 / JCM 4913 / KCC S-0913 / 768) TaxID=1214101 RepID=K4QXM1_STRDJ|nr:MFS transporter [Streptomyces davaonensis]CCK25595.1 major facilitator transporter [Streptomyces davaonensis JCM 4913]
MTHIPRKGATALLAAMAGTAIADNYTLQPALTVVAADLDVPLSAISLVPSAALAGSMAGFALLLPLADRVAPARLVAAHFAALAVGLVLAATATDAAVLVAAHLIIGAAAAVAAQASVIAGRLAAPGRRGAAVALVATGLSAGILLSRLVGGALTDLIGWRAMLMVCAVLALLCAGTAMSRLPGERPLARDPYRTALAALPRLPLREARLRHAVATGGLWYLAFTLLWVGLALFLARPPHSLDPTAIGLFGLAGLLGFAVLPFTGRLVDRRGPRTVMTVAVAVAASGVLLIALAPDSVLAIAVGLAVFDAGCFVAQAANQSVVIGIDPANSGSFSGAYLVLYFAVGALGTALAGPLIDGIGMRGTTLVALGALIAAALLAHFGSVRETAPSPSYE